MSVRSALVLCLGLAGPLLAQGAPPEGRGDEQPVPTVPAGEVTVAELAETWTRVTGAPVSVDPQAAPIVLRFGLETRLERPVLRTLLGLHEVVVVEDPRGGLQLHHQRNLATRAPVTSPVITGQAPAGDTLVTWVHYVRHGGGNGIFATLRGLMVRDMNRIGNVLWLPEANALLVADLAPQVRYYQEVVRKLDVARPVMTLRLRLLELPRERWSELAGRARGPELVRQLEGEATAVELESAALDLAGEGFALHREHRLADAVRQVRVRVGPRPTGEGAAGGRAGAAEESLLSLEVLIQSPAEELARRLELPVPSLSGEEVTLVHTFAGRAGKGPSQLVLVLELRPRS